MDISVRGRGRSIVSSVQSSENCVCYRPRCFVLCTNCGYHIWGRVRHTCPVHPQTLFLIDLTQCPHCKAYESFMCEFKDATEET